MLRLRLATLAVATGFLFTLSGCMSTCEEGRLFPRLFNSTSRSGSWMHSDCDCHDAHSAPLMMEPAVKGPILTPPGSGVPVITNIPANQPPQVFKVPTATTTPYVPAN